MSRLQVSPRTVQEFVRGLAFPADPDALLERIGQQLRELFHPDLILILQVESQNRGFTPLYSLGHSRDLLEGFGLSEHGHIPKWLAKNQKCLDLSRQLGLLDQLDPAERELLARLRVKFCAPLISLNHLIGIVLLGSGDPAWRLDPDELDLLDTLSTQAALALENAILHSRQKERLQHFVLAERLAAVGQLAAGLAHEVRNPLGAISSTMQYLLRDLARGDPKRPLVEGLLSEVDRINRTLGQLLNLARGPEVHPLPQNLLDAVESSLLLIDGQARQQGVKIIREYGEDAFIVLGEADALKQLFLNILLNAIQAMPTGGVLRVRVRSWQPPFHPGSDPRVQVEVGDTGCGIPEANNRHLFEPFFTTKPEGTGLGLAICQSIVHRHEGEIEVSSQMGKETTVTLRLPLVD